MQRHEQALIHSLRVHLRHENSLSWDVSETNNTANAVSKENIEISFIHLLNIKWATFLYYVFNAKENYKPYLKILEETILDYSD